MLGLGLKMFMYVVSILLFFRFSVILVGCDMWKRCVIGRIVINWWVLISWGLCICLLVKVLGFVL